MEALSLLIASLECHGLICTPIFLLHPRVDSELKGRSAHSIHAKCRLNSELELAVLLYDLKQVKDQEQNQRERETYPVDDDVDFRTGVRDFRDRR